MTKDKSWYNIELNDLLKTDVEWLKLTLKELEQIWEAVHNPSIISVMLGALKLRRKIILEKALERPVVKRLLGKVLKL